MVIAILVVLTILLIYWDYKKNQKKVDTKVINENQESSSNNFFKITKSNNNMATILSILGWFEMIGGIILGIILGNNFEIGYYYGRTFNWGICIGVIIACIIGGIFILALGEIIQKLQNIEDNTRK